MARRAGQWRRVDLAAAACAGVFVVVLAVSAYWDPSIRLLHVFESLLYVAAGTLCLRQSKFGYALGIAGGSFWLWMAGVRTTFVRNGFELLEILVRTGSVHRPDVLIAVPAALATAGLAVCSVVGYVSLREKSWRDAGIIVAGFVIVPVFFLAILWAFAPQYLSMFRHIL